MFITMPVRRPILAVLRVKAVKQSERSSEAHVSLIFFLSAMGDVIGVSGKGKLFAQDRRPLLAGLLHLPC